MIRKFTNCYICGMSENLKKCMCICGPPTFANKARFLNHIGTLTVILKQVIHTFEQVRKFAELICGPPTIPLYCTFEEMYARISIFVNLNTCFFRMERTGNRLAHFFPTYSNDGRRTHKVTAMQRIRRCRLPLAKTTVLRRIWPMIHRQVLTDIFIPAKKAKK
jgi:hypothetical protein